MTAAQIGLRAINHGSIAMAFAVPTWRKFSKQAEILLSRSYSYGHDDQQLDTQTIRYSMWL